MFRASLCPSPGEQEEDWLKLHVKVLGCAPCGCVEPWCRLCALFESFCSTAAVASVGSIIHLIVPIFLKNLFL
jgi:hypothetical protein